MTIAGGCATGSIWRAGEGQVKLMISTVTMLLLIPVFGKYVAKPFGDKLSEWGLAKSVFLPDVMGWSGAILLIVGFCAIWYAFVHWNEKTEKFSAY